MGDRHHSDKGEKIECLSYEPGLRDSGDLEAGIKTITATSEASGLGNADYSKSLTLPKPGDARLLVKRIAARLAVTIDTIPTGDTTLYCRVYVDQQNADNRLFDVNWNSTGAKVEAVDTHPGNKPTIFNLLKDGASHSFYFFFWKAGTGAGIVISLVQLWEAVGSQSLVYAYPEALRINHKGFVSMFVMPARIGTGACTARLVFPETTTYIFEKTTEFGLASALICNHALALSGTVATDLNYINMMNIVLRSEQ